MIEQGFSYKKLEDTARLLVPHLFLLLLLLFNVAALPFLPADMMKPQLVLMAVYYWAIYRPTLLPPFFCFLIGLFMDILIGLPPGIHAFIFVLTQWIVREQRRFMMGQPYSTLWAVFGLVALLSGFLQWGLYGLAYFSWGPVMPVLAGTLASVFLFPLITLLLVFTHRILPVASRAYP